MAVLKPEKFVKELGTKVYKGMGKKYNVYSTNFTNDKNITIPALVFNKGNQNYILPLTQVYDEYVNDFDGKINPLCEDICKRLETFKQEYPEPDFVNTIGKTIYNNLGGRFKVSIVNMKDENKNLVIPSIICSANEIHYMEPLTQALNDFNIVYEKDYDRYCKKTCEKVEAFHEFNREEEELEIE